jgi:hypothetical protein
MHLDMECPFKDNCANDICTIKLFYKHPPIYNIYKVLKDIDYVLPNFFVTSIDYGTKICLRCYNFKGKN